MNNVYMKKMAFSVTIALVLIIGYCGGCSALNKFFGEGDDNQIEENIENIIESKIGLKPGTIDLTPDSKED